MANNFLRGVLGFKGERGYSAYEIAKQKGFIGTEQDWLATLGTASYFDRCSDIYTTTTTGEKEFDVPDCYTSNSFIDVYVEGKRLNSDEYTVNTSTRKITLISPLDVVGTKVEVVTLTMATNSLPIGETIDANSTNETAPGTKAVYDYVENKLATEVPETIIDDDTTSAEKTYSSNKINDITNDFYDNLTNGLAEKLNKSNIQILAGSISNIGAGSTATKDIEYPTGFNKNNTLIISKMSSNNNVYYDVTNFDPTANGYPGIKTIALTDDVIRVWMENTNSSEAKIGYYKITLLKID